MSTRLATTAPSDGYRIGPRDGYPVCAKYVASPWSPSLLVIERMTASLSTCRATCGNSELTGMPLWPYCLNFHGEAMTLPTLLNCVGSIFAPNGRPFSLVSRGLGSKVSTWLGPPKR